MQLINWRIHDMVSTEGYVADSDHASRHFNRESVELEVYNEQHSE